MYPPHLVAPMKEDLTNVGFQQLVSAEDVDLFIITNNRMAYVLHMYTYLMCTASMNTKLYP